MFRTLLIGVFLFCFGCFDDDLNNDSHQRLSRAVEDTSGNSSNHHIESHQDNGSQHKTIERPWLGQRVDVRELFLKQGYKIPSNVFSLFPFRRPQTAAGTYEEFPGFVRHTKCHKNFCIDGLRDVKTQQYIIAPNLTPEEREHFSENGWFERYVSVASTASRLRKLSNETEYVDHYVSLYVGHVWYSHGAAHSNALLTCQTHLIRENKKISLNEMIPGNRAKQIIDHVNVLSLNPETAVTILGSNLTTADIAYTAHLHGFRLVQGPSDEPSLILCLEQTVPGAGMGTIHEISAENLPILYLMRDQMLGEERSVP